MKQYHELLRHILDEGVERSDRTGVGTLSCFGYQMRFDLQEGFPLVTTKKVHFKSILHELIWFIQGDTNLRYLVQNGVNIWNEWPYQRWLRETGQEDEYPKYTDAWKRKMSEFVEQIRSDEAFAAKWGELGPVYGKQWRDFNGFDQLNAVIEEIKRNPTSRRHIVSAWNPPEIEEMAKAGLPPCHTLFQFYVHDGRLSCQLYQRSADTFLGVPFNIGSYALLTVLVAAVTGNEPGEFVHTFGDVHLYKNHLEQVDLQLTREPRPLPEIHIHRTTSDITAFTAADIELVNYDPWPAIRGAVAV